jgi:hypothetical protein
MRRVGPRPAPAGDLSRALTYPWQNGSAGRPPAGVPPVVGPELRLLLLRPAPRGAARRGLRGARVPGRRARRGCASAPQPLRRHVRRERRASHPPLRAGGADHGHRRPIRLGRLAQPERGQLPRLRGELPGYAGTLDLRLPQQPAAPLPGHVRAARPRALANGHRPPPRRDRSQRAPALPRLDRRDHPRAGDRVRDAGAPPAAATTGRRGGMAEAPPRAGHALGAEGRAHGGRPGVTGSCRHRRNWSAAHGSHPGGRATASRDPAPFASLAA